MNLFDLLATLPLIVLVAWAILLILVDLFLPKGRKSWLVILAALGLVVTLLLWVVPSRQDYSAFSGMIMVDGFSIFLSALFLISGWWRLLYLMITSSAWGSTAASITF